MLQPEIKWKKYNKVHVHVTLINNKNYYFYENNNYEGNRLANT